VGDWTNAKLQCDIYEVFSSYYCNAVRVWRLYIPLSIPSNTTTPPPHSDYEYFVFLVHYPLTSTYNMYYYAPKVYADQEKFWTWIELFSRINTVSVAKLITAFTQHNLTGDVVVSGIFYPNGGNEPKSLVVYSVSLQTFTYYDMVTAATNLQLIASEWGWLLILTGSFHSVCSFDSEIV
jgi:hypothetical protein